MAYNEITIHDRKFAIDTMDWHHEDDAETVADQIAARMDVWDPDYAAQVHALQLQAQAGEIPFDHGVLADVLDMCRDCASAVLSTYNAAPEVGHNYSIGAIEQ